jgi:hypothetical protein
VTITRNVNPPVFNATTYSSPQIPEKFGLGLSIVQVFATDADAAVGTSHKWSVLFNMTLTA